MICWAISVGSDSMAESDSYVVTSASSRSSRAQAAQQYLHFLLLLLLKRSTFVSALRRLDLSLRHAWEIEGGW